MKRDTAGSSLKLVSTNSPFDKGNTVFRFARMLHEAGHTNEA